MRERFEGENIRRKEMFANIFVFNSNKHIVGKDFRIIFFRLRDT